MPTTAIQTFSNLRLEPYMDSEDARMMNVALAATQTLARGTVLGEVTASPGTYKAYASGNSDGSQVAKVVLVYDVVVDGSGNITRATSGSGGVWGETSKYAEVYYAGTFKTSELTGLDATAVSALGHLVQGTAADGILRIG